MREYDYDSNNEPYGEDFPQKSSKKEKALSGRIIVLALCFSLLGGALGAGGVLLAQKLRAEPDVSATKPSQNQTAILQGNRENTVIDITQIDTSRQMTPAEVYAANVNSTVGITTSIKTNFWGYTSTSAASGSGFIISEDGYILTNHHVIDESDSITVSLYNGDSYDAKLIGFDESNDIAVLKIDANGLSPVVLGDSENLNVGDSVVAIGNPLGELTFSLTAGAISAMDREVTLAANMTMNLLQTDCAINSGNSGGALFNLYGEVIGVTNAKYSGSSGSGASIDNIAFAIPINTVRPIVESIIEKGYVSKPYVGLLVKDVSKEHQMYGLPQGAAIQSVEKDSPAEKAGLVAGDIITRINGKEVTGARELISLAAGSQIGDILEMTVYRKGQTMELQVTVGEYIQSAGSSS